MAKKRSAETGRFVSAKSNGKPKPDGTLTDNQRAYMVSEFINNELFSRSRFIKAMQDPRRDIDDECGYPKTEEITSIEYKGMYDRLSIATRVVQLMPQESWKVSPTIFETEDAEETTEFETAWKELGASLRKNSKFESEEGSPIWEYLRRADELSGIGSYGVLLIGIDDGLELKDPIAGFEKGEPEVAVNLSGSLEIVPTVRSSRKLLFLRAFDQSLAQITSYEQNPANPRFGQPNSYNLSFSDPTNTGSTAEGLQLTMHAVHWSRIVHLADNLGSSEVLGVPRQRPVYNRLLDLRKLLGGSAEMYWKGAFPGLSIESDPTLGGDVDVDDEALKDAMERYGNGLQRWIKLIGVTAKSLAPQVVDPTPQIMVQLQAIAIQLQVPMRVLMGSERGELASTQDSEAWDDRVDGRRNNYVTPRIIVPFVDRLTMIGILPEPESYSVVWPELDTLNKQEQADVALKHTDAMAKYVQGGVEALMPPMEYFVNILGMTQEEAEAVIEAAMGHIEEMKADEAEEHNLEREELAEDGQTEFDRSKELQRMESK